MIIYPQWWRNHFVWVEFLLSLVIGFVFGW